MLKLSTVAVCALVLSSGVALAQTGRMLPAGPNAAPGSANPPAPTMGSPTATAPDKQDRMQGGTPSMQGQRQDADQAQGPTRSLSSGDRDNPRAVAITDEYGNRYNSRGERIGQGRPGR